MRRPLPALIFALIAFALTFAVSGPVKAESSALAQPSIAATAAAMAADLIEADLIEAHDADGDCRHAGCPARANGCVCCPAAGLAALPEAPDAAPPVRLKAVHALPPDSGRDGITVRPVTGPPKLSV